MLTSVFGQSECFGELGRELYTRDQHCGVVFWVGMGKVVLPIGRGIRLEGAEFFVRFIHEGYYYFD